MKSRAILVVFLLGVAGVECVPAAQGTLIDVPFVHQTSDGCGSASISMIIRHWEKTDGQSVPPAADAMKIQAALFSRAAGGIPASRMQKYFQESGYRAFAFQGQWEDLKRHIEQGRPLIVSLRAGRPFAPLHYVVVVGIDPGRGFVFLNDPAQQKTLRVSREGFESEWNPTHNWTLLAVPQSGD
jgi:ABC-type bacteriocin/lantibiotic exporter with double-glycine peptidase domain